MAGGGVGAVGGCPGAVVAALVLWNPLVAEVMGLRRRSLFSVVKKSRKLVYVLLVVGLRHHMLQARGNTPVDSNKMVVRSMRVASEMGSLPAVAMRWTSQRRSQSVSMGSEGDQSGAMLARLHSKSLRVMVL